MLKIMGCRVVSAQSPRLSGSYRSRLKGRMEPSRKPLLAWSVDGGQSRLDQLERVRFPSGEEGHRAV